MEEVKKVCSVDKVSLTKLSHNIEGLEEGLVITREFTELFPPIGFNTIKIFDIIIDKREIKLLLNHIEIRVMFD